MKILSRVCLVLLFVFMVFYPASASSQLQWGRASLVGNLAPNFELQTSDGSLNTLTKFRNGDNAIVFFWATWCPHCQTQLKELSDRKEEFEKKNIKIVLVNEGETRRVVSSFFRENDIEFEVFFDSEGEVGKTYQIVGLPTFHFIDSQGIIKAAEHYLPENYEFFFVLDGK